MAYLSAQPKMQFFGDDGLPLAGGKVYTYAGGTTTPLATYKDPNMDVANTNPIILDAYGRALVWFTTASYTLAVYDSVNVLQGSGGLMEYPAASVQVDLDIAEVEITRLGTAKADLAGPTFTGVPKAPTASVGTNTTQLATTAFVLANGNPVPTISTVVPIYGDIRGGSISKSANHDLLILPCSCLDSTGRILLYTSTNKTLTLPTASDTIYHIFMVRLAADSSIEFRAYTTEAGVTSDAQVNAYRWIAYWATTTASNCRAGAMVDGTIWWERFSENTIHAATDPPAGVTTAIDISAKIPVSRVIEAMFGIVSVTNNIIIAIGAVSGSTVTSFSGSTLYNSAGDIFEWQLYSSQCFVPILSNSIYWGEGTYTNNAGTAQLAVHAVRLRR